MFIELKNNEICEEKEKIVDCIANLFPSTKYSEK